MNRIPFYYDGIKVYFSKKTFTWCKNMEFVTDSSRYINYHLKNNKKERNTATQMKPNLACISAGNFPVLNILVSKLSCEIWNYYMYTIFFYCLRFSGLYHKSVFEKNKIEINLSFSLWFQRVKQVTQVFFEKLT